MKGIEKFNELVQSLANLPTIGKKTALRLAYYICMENNLSGLKIAHDIENAIRFIKSCHICGGLSEDEICQICSDEDRNKNLICIVQSPKDILTIEESNSYNGLYFVLENTDESVIKKLEFMINNFNSKELIFALTHGVNSDACIFFIEEKLKHLNLKFSKIAQGIPNGVHLENVDFVSLNNAINFRTHID